jgi:hypothetical protein
MTATAARILALEAEVADLRRQLESRDPENRLAGMNAQQFGELIREWARARQEARCERAERTEGETKS